MTGKPAARITDKVAGGKIVTGSLTVLIGSQGGIACSVCPGGQGVGSPVNPQLGAKVLTGSEDLDFALPGPLPVVWQRQYSSYINLEQGSRCGPLGHGWKLPQQLRIELTQDDCLLHDAAGRTLTFGALAPGQSLYSASEDIWIVRGGQEAAWHSEARWSHVPPSWAGSPDCILAASGNAAVVWAFAPVAAFEPALTPPAPQHWRLQAQLDRFGRSQRYTYAPKPDAQETQETQKTQASRSKQATTGSELLQVHQAHQAPVPEGHLIGLTDGAGRSYRLHYQQVCSALPANGLWGEDDGWRLASVELVSDPVGTGTLPLTLVHYGYDRTGQLSTVHDRTGIVVREFAWQHRRMSSHRYASGPLHTYIYESTEPGARVIEHGNEQGLNYRFEYLKQNPSPAGLPQTATRVTDSLGRIDTYHYEGQAGLARLVRHQRADGSELRFAYDAAGRLSSSTDPLGRTTRLQRDSQGQLTSVQSPSDKPGGQRSSQRYDESTGLLLQSTDAGGISTHYRYDPWGRLVTVEQADGGGGSAGGDSENTTERTTERITYPDPKTHPRTCEHPSTIQDAQGGTKHLAWSEAGLLVGRTDCSGRSTQYQYDRFGELTAVSNALGQSLRHERDARGRITATRQPDGSKECYQLDQSGRITQIQAEAPDGQNAGSPITLAYDLWGRLTQRTHGALSLQFEYDAAGRLKRLVNENQAQSRFAWDVMDRLVQEEGFDQRLQSYSWDAAGQLIEARDGNARNQQSTRYRWDAAGRLAQRQLPGHESDKASETEKNKADSDNTTTSTLQRFEWDAAGRLLAARSHGCAPEELLHSEALFTRDALGRITGEVQRLHDRQGKLEFEHSIHHQLGVLGNRQTTALQGLGQIGYLHYGAGHVHGLTHNGSVLMDLERDALHRETKRQLKGVAAENGAAGQPSETTGPHPLTDPNASAPTNKRAELEIERRWDSLGRLQALHSTGLQASTTNTAGTRAPQTLIGQLTERQYHYDALGQLIAIEAPGHTQRYGYDPAGRLRAMLSSLQPEQQTRWNIDPAGNRLPGQSSQAQNTQPEWAAQVHAHWQQTQFNLLGQGNANNPGNASATRWPDNRIGYSHEHAWRYDAFGNRAEQLSEDGRRQTLAYDGAHQLIEVKVQGPVIGSANEASHESITSRYRYDALGRRLKKVSVVSNANAIDAASESTPPETTHYYGWDGDRLVHTERTHAQSPEQRQISHTVYEPGSFTPLIRLSTLAGPAKPKAHALLLAVQGALQDQDEDQDEEDQSETTAQMQAILAAMPHSTRNALDLHLRQAAKKELSKEAKEALADQAQNVSQRLTGMREQLVKQEQTCETPVTIEFYHCDHLGTPIALTDDQHEIVWAARLDPWGNVQEEFNPSGMDQDIRLPGQHHDRETGLYYNRYRYYDPGIGSYINQDPIGLAGGANSFGYANSSPLHWTDPLGLFTYHGNWCGPSWTGGREETYKPNSDPNYYKPPIDMVDKACMNHDICYYECRESFSCSSLDRGKCMTECDRSLDAASSGSRLPSGMSAAQKSGLETWMGNNKFPDAGLNSNSCPMPPSNVDINKMFNNWPR